MFWFNCGNWFNFSYKNNEEILFHDQKFGLLQQDMEPPNNTLVNIENQTVKL